MSRPRRRICKTAAWRKAGAGLLALAALAGALAACGGPDAERTAGAPVLTVATGLWPLAQAAAEIGGGNVQVEDVVPAGDNPLTSTLSGAQVERVKKAGLALEIGDGFQPTFERAAGHTRTAVVASGSGDPYIWLNPYDMEKVATKVALAMEAANPKADKTYSAGLDSFQAQLSSLDADYQSTLSACPDDTLVTVGDAFAVLSPRYTVHDDDVAPPDPGPLPSTATVKQEVSAIKASGASVVYSDTWIPQSAIVEASAIDDVRVSPIDTLVGEPPGGWKGKPTYFFQMEQVLSVLSSALHCPSPAAD